MVRDLLQNSPTPALVIDERGIVLFANPASEHLFERSRLELLGRPIRFSLGVDQMTVTRSDGTQEHIRLHHADIPWNGQGARIVWFVESARLESPQAATDTNGTQQALTARVASAEAERDALAGQLADAEARTALLQDQVSALQQSEQEAREQAEAAGRRLAHVQRQLDQASPGASAETERLAFEDALTGLPNLNIIRQYLDVTLKKAFHDRGAVALLMIDIDRFRVVNDTLGERAGDEIIRQVASRLRSLVGPDDALGRKGADEFLLVVGAGDRENPNKNAVGLATQKAEEAARRIFNALDSAIRVGDHAVHLTVSIGISMYPGASSTDEMLANAASAALRAKELGRSDYQFFTSDIKAELERRQTVAAGLRQALEAHEFVLHYQPIVELATGRLAGAEALLRWQHPIKGLIGPAEFLAVAEETNLIVPIGAWVIDTACEEAHRMGNKGFISINLSAQQFLHSNFLDQFMVSLDRARAKPRSVVVEIPEGIGTGWNERIREVLAQLAERGVELGVDDFGSGSSSLKDLDGSRLKFLKIDRAFVQGVPGDKRSMNIAKAIIGLAESLETDCLAEGVEHLEQVTGLRAMGCKLAQGHYFSPAVTDEQLEELKKHRWSV